MILQWLLCDRQNYPMPDWRWLLDRDDSPWYPTARLFRQEDSRQWNSSLAACAPLWPTFCTGTDRRLA
jgi:hypothetical protein